MKTATVQGRRSNRSVIHPIFAKHQTFHPRFGWLKKGVDKADEDNQVFKKDSASVVLGVGKNMVKAIRYWCIAFKVVDEIKVEGNKSIHKPSRLAKNLLKEEGWDPYLENPGSLWLLHWNLFKSPCYAPSWHLAFNDFNQVEFTPEDLLFALKEYKNRVFPSARASDSSFKKDVNCLLRMYVERINAKHIKEDSINCPFKELGIITPYNNSKRYVFNFGTKPNLAPEIIVSACLEFAHFFLDDSKTVSISRLLYDSGSPGQIFKLTESSLCEAIEETTKYNGDVFLTDTAGMIRFGYSDEPLSISRNLLEHFYNEGK